VNGHPTDCREGVLRHVGEVQVLLDPPEAQGIQATQLRHPRAGRVVLSLALELEAPPEDHGDHVDETDHVDLLVGEDAEPAQLRLDGARLVLRQPAESLVEPLAHRAQVIAQDHPLVSSGLSQEPYHRDHRRAQSLRIVGRHVRPGHKTRRVQDGSLNPGDIVVPILTSTT
jgi:hypothetical protein